MSTRRISDTDIRFMRRALALAKRGGGRVSPNPQVGCVLVRSGRVVAEGWHAVFGGPHAEAVALKRAGSRARGATAYVNLEPCCHTQKKTPPCVPALVAAGVRRVVIGMKDPNPQVRGRGIRELQKTGIRVTAGVLEKECADLSRPFAVRIKKRRPYVILKAATSLDGRIETARGESKWITSPAAREASNKMRSEVDAILVGINTVLKDDPSLTAHGHGRNPLRIILDSKCRIPPRARALDAQAPTLIATSHPSIHSLKKIRNAAAVHFPQNKNGIDLKALLKYLLKIDIGTVLVEGGSRVHTSFLEAGLVDELRLFLAPKLIGGENARGFFEGRGIGRLKGSLQLSDLSFCRIGQDILVTGHLN